MPRLPAQRQPLFAANPAVAGTLPDPQPLTYLPMVRRLWVVVCSSRAHSGLITHATNTGVRAGRPRYGDACAAWRRCVFCMRAMRTRRVDVVVHGRAANGPGTSRPCSKCGRAPRARPRLHLRGGLSIRTRRKKAKLERPRVPLCNTSASCYALYEHRNPS